MDRSLEEVLSMPLPSQNPEWRRAHGLDEPAEGEEDFYVEILIREKVVAHTEGAAIDALIAKRVVGGEALHDANVPFSELICRVARTPFYD